MKKDGVVYTKQETVCFMLDLIGYTSDKPLFNYSILEPSFGYGSFVDEIVSRLIKSIQKYHPESLNLDNCLRGVELDIEPYLVVKDRVTKELDNLCIEDLDIVDIIDKWFINGDYILYKPDISFDYICGNPPYIRSEMCKKMYASIFPDISLKADIYIPFYLKSLSELKSRGVHTFICSDRWTKNNFGKSLRASIVNNYSLDVYVDLYKASPFLESVTAYPAITVISNSNQSNVISYSKVINVETINTDYNQNLVLVNSNILYKTPWVFNESISNLIDKLNYKFPSITESGCKIGIGLATGKDSVFICDHCPDVESDRVMNIRMTKNRNAYLINPWNEFGDLIQLEDYPKLKKYFTLHEQELTSRYVAKKNPKLWYRTIDKPNYAILKEPKLFISDLGTKANITYDEGNNYPHHNLYYITSSKWDLFALKHLLESFISLFFISFYSVKMNSGTVRFQAQHLIKIHLPEWNDIDIEDQSILISESPDSLRFKDTIMRIYEISENEVNMIHSFLEL